MSPLFPLAWFDDPPTAQPWVAIVLAAAGLVFLARQLYRVRGTTLVAPVVWGMISLVALASVHSAHLFLEPGTAEAWNFVAAMSTFCPPMALLGAKRPQDRAWQFIVLSLWIILALPAARWLLWGGVREIHPARGWFLAILIAAAASNRLGTRAWLSGLLYGAGQCALVWPYVSTSEQAVMASVPALGPALIVASWGLASLEWLPRARARGWRQVWFDFREAYGVLWSLRVAERFNHAARAGDWPVRLQWPGFFMFGANEPADEIPVEAANHARSLLRRFVSAEWIDERLRLPS